MKARWILIIAVMTLGLASGERVRASGDTRFQWSISSQVALAVDGSNIMLTGAGTFAPGDTEEVTGGGTWSLSTGGGGTFKVTQLIRFDVTPGSLPNPSLHGGLLFLRVAYNDGSRGILAISCAAGSAGATNVAEGTTASKGFVDYYNIAPDSHTPPFQQLAESE